MVRRLDQLDLIPRNFIQVNLVLNSQNPETVAEKPALSAEGMLSNVGGSLSLWLGMTVMFVFEIVEFIIIIVSNWYSSRRMTKMNDVSKTVNKDTTVDGPQSISCYV
jgi:amiloride-sensitive sodium channel subunit alpha